MDVAPEAAEVEKSALEAMTPEDQILLREVFADPAKSIGFTERHPACGTATRRRLSAPYEKCRPLTG